MLQTRTTEYQPLQASELRRRTLAECGCRGFKHCPEGNKLRVIWNAAPDTDKLPAFRTYQQHREAAGIRF